MVVQKSIHLPLSSLTSPRVLMCASVGTEGSVTLQLRDTNSSIDSNHSPASTSLENALTIGYPDPEMLADVLGTLQTASLKNNSTTITTKSHNNNISINNITNNNKITISRRNSTIPIKESNKITVQTVSTSTNTTNKTNSYIKNCLIRSSSCSNTNNVTSLAQIMSNSNSSNSSNSILNNTTNSNSNCSSNSNFSSSSNDSTISITSNTSGGNLKNGNNLIAHGIKNVPGSATATAIVKKSRPKLSSPTRHGPQQCLICSKIFGNASALAKHKLTHSDERKYVCVMCSKAFKRQDHLNGHMMTHRNKKPYECKAEGCGKSYCDARSLRRHTENHHAGVITPQNQTLSPTAGTPSGLSLSPATASGDASSPDGATCIRTYISNGGTVVDAATGLPLTEEQIKAINLPIKTSVTLLSPTSSTSSGGASMSAASPTISLTDNSNMEADGLTREQLDLISKIMQQTKQTSAQVTVSSSTSVNSYKVDTAIAPPQTTSPQSIVQNRPRTWNMQLLNTTQNVSITVDEV
ncbi:sal-like protein 1, partial [Teleopsis dalmanni]|uniref:sal-like protein 1 n=1 Tax=Teleopsis dalmanni TaxID=139649 RepID=UPI0018CD10E5